MCGDTTVQNIWLKIKRLSFRGFMCRFKKENMYRIKRPCFTSVGLKVIMEVSVLVVTDGRSQKTDDGLALRNCCLCITQIFINKILPSKIRNTVASGQDSRAGKYWAYRPPSRHGHLKITTTEQPSLRST